MNSWFVQLSAINTDKLLTEEFPMLFHYELGNAKMKTLPSVGDCVIILGKKHELCKGFIHSTYENVNVLFLESLNPVYTGKFYRRNWTLIKN